MDPRNRTERLDKVRKGLKASDDMELPMSEDFFDKLHDKIMAEVEKTDIAPAPLLMRPRSVFRSRWREWANPVGGVLSLFLLTFIALNQTDKFNQSMERAGLASDGRERIVSEAILSPEDLSQTLITTQNESDFFIDVAGESFENLTVSKINQIMGESETSHP